MDTATIIFAADCFIMWTIYLITSAINQYTQPTEDEEGNSHITDRHLTIIRSTAFSIYFFAWPLHTLLREYLS